MLPGQDGVQLATGVAIPVPRGQRADCSRTSRAIPGATLFLLWVSLTSSIAGGKTLEDSNGPFNIAFLLLAPGALM